MSVVVVTFNSAATIAGFLWSLAAGLQGVGSWRLVVVDNGSDDDTLRIVRRMAPAATVVPTGRNGGYAVGVNRGVAASPPATAVLIANPDVRLDPGAVRRLLAALAADPAAGIAVPRIRHGDGRLAATLRREPTVRRVLGEALLGGSRAGRHPTWGEMITDPSAYLRSRVVDWASGALMLVSAECLHRVGAWDESLFLYGEETDFALRAADAGLHVRYVPEAGAVHLGGAAHTSPRLWSLLVRNRLVVYRRRHGPAAAVVYRCALLLNEILRAVAGRSTSRAAVRALLARGARPGGGA